MKVLAWDTSSKSGVIVAFESDSEKLKTTRLIAEFVLNVEATHSEGLLWGIHQVLEAARWKLEDIDLFGVGLGPGSFTGLRIGMTTARTLSHTLNKPIVGVSSLAALARAVSLYAPLFPSETLIVASTDACKGELFALWGAAKEVENCAVFTGPEIKGVWSNQVQEQVIEPHLLMGALSVELKKMGPHAKWIALGEGRDRYPEEWIKIHSSELTLKENFKHYSRQIQARILGQLVWEGYCAGACSKGIELSPRYLRLSNAELKLRSSIQAKEAVK